MDNYIYLKNPLSDDMIYMQINKIYKAILYIFNKKANDYCIF
jgi:hypothetical protein